jgi:hypothetical protein
MGNNRMVMGVFMFLLFSSLALSQPKYPLLSPGAIVSQIIGITNVTVSYHRPGVKGRLIWGEVVPFDKIWRAGANEATTIEFSTEVTIGDAKVPAGKYSFFILLNEAGKKATLILNKDADQWGAYNYDQAKDIVRIAVRPEYLPHQEWLIYTFTDLKNDFANLQMHWEDFAVNLPIKVNTNTLVLEGARKAKGWKEKMEAARYCLDNDVSLDEGTKWIGESVAEQKNYSNLNIQAQLLAKQNKMNDAIKVMQEALIFGKKMDKAPGNIKDMEELLKVWQQK